jgi:hypothetical protein
VTATVLPSTGTKPHSVSYSETSSYLLCQRKWEYGYGRSLKRVTESHSLAMGSGGHSILEAFYRVILAAGDELKPQQKAFDSALSAAREKYDQLVKEGYQDADNKATLESMLFEFYFPNEPFVKEGWRILAVEKDFVIDTVMDEETEETIRTPFVIDLIALDPNGKTVVIDHKFIYEFYSYEDARLQPQIPLYIAGLRGLGYRIDYGAYNMLRNRKIKEPNLSQRVGWLELKPSTQRVQRTWIEQLDTAQQIIALSTLSESDRDTKMHRVANKMVCQSCSFKDLCMTELEGGNVSLMLRTEYTIRERRVFTTETEEAS